MEHSFTLPPSHEYACIIIGDEILGGYVSETNLSYLVPAMSHKGYFLKEARIITDSKDDIATTLTELRKKYSFVVSCGGLGPTHDDNTMEGFAKSFDTSLHTNEEMRAFFHKSMKDKNTEERAESALQMSQLPLDTELIQLSEHKWPLLKLENCYALPGLPSLCRQTIDILTSILPAQSPIYHADCFVTISEHVYLQYLNEIAKKYAKTVTIGSYPLDDPDKNNTTRSKIALTSTHEADFHACFQEIQHYMQSHRYLVEASVHDQQ